MRCLLVALLLLVAGCGAKQTETVGRKQYLVTSSAYSRTAVRDGVQASYTSSTDGNSTTYSIVVRAASYFSCPIDKV